MILFHMRQNVGLVTQHVRRAAMPEQRNYLKTLPGWVIRYESIDGHRVVYYPSLTLELSRNDVGYGYFKFW